jgi:hypothetical protein
MNLSLFTKRAAEQAAVAFVGGFAASLVASDSLTRAAVVAGLSAGARAVYGLIVRMVGTGDTPSAL